MSDRMPPPVDPTPATPAIPAGWYNDGVSTKQRWWDGTSWTAQYLEPPAAARPFRWKRGLIGLGVVVLLLIIFLASRVGSPGTTSESGGSVGTRSSVEWADYSPGLQGQIDTLQNSKDCGALQSQFDAADANSTVTMNRTGHSNAKLLAYIDEALRLANCY